MNISGRHIPYFILLKSLNLVNSNINHLDMGCDGGDSTFLIWHMSNGFTSYAYDLNSDAIKGAQKKYGKYSKDGLNFLSDKDEIPDLHFDLITALEVLEHVYDEGKFLQFIESKMSEKTYLMLSVPHKGLFDFLDPFNYRHLLPKKLFVKLYGLIKGNDPVFDDRPRHRHYSKAQLENLMNAIDCEIIKFRRYGFLFFYLKWIYSDILDRRFSANKVYRVGWRILNKLADMEMSSRFGGLSAGITIICKKKPV